MKYYAKLVSLNDDIEEEAVLSLGEKEICCFIDSAPYPLIEGDIYLVEINVSFLDEEELSEAGSVNLSFDRVGETFSYEIVGFLSGDTLITDGIIFRDEFFAEEFSFLNSKYVALKPDRISVSFL
ncbi:hypothetical protein [Pluralibacter gergoviae]|uniref:hypothetical protein n=1 Tax=Pluralibacter gergoviae TaxID=61647 RepID=UPI000650264D|nr:hypothetical protein [Pluralibacter gergoviae]EKV0928894.1 hypothetical protein [Pluralibacter gergoviae]EKV6250005.1 hypothetical protein [Pluralibacter gergoviae]EKW9968179.1 hypothetical protein [Pluralibacter gergoviae]ELD4274399.1 hypothetical protein [Pluralibacter gergoviae]ELD4280015.1 hypothetical protein [Pluralibacter gergoviae]